MKFPEKGEGMHTFFKNAPVPLLPRRTLIASKSALFMDYLHYFSGGIDKNSLLYIYANISEKQFKDWMVKLKNRLLKLAYECAISGLDLNNWLTNWISLKILHPVSELLPIANINTSPTEIYKPKEHIKYLTTFLHPKVKDIMDAVYIGDYNEIYQSYLQKLSSKKEKQVSEYIKIFYELMVLLLKSPKRFFESQLDCLGFQKSYVYSTIEYFFMNIAFVDSFPAFITLWDVLRLASSVLTEGNKKQLIQLAEKFGVGIDSFKYNVDNIMKFIQRSFCGEAFISEEDKLINLEQYAPQKQEKAYTAPEFTSLLKKLHKHFYLYKGEIENIGMELCEVNILNEKKDMVVVEWLEKSLVSECNSIDEGKLLKKVGILVYALDLISKEQYNNIANRIIKKLIGKFGAKLVDKSEVCVLELVPKQSISGNPSLEELHEFITQNPALLTATHKKISDIAKATYEALKPTPDQYKSLSKTTKRLSDALISNNVKVKVVGSAAAGLWPGTTVDYSAILENDISALPSEHYPKLASLIVESGIGTPEMNVGTHPLLYTDKETGLRCRIGFNRVLDIHASSLLLAYGKYDEKFKIMVYFVKEWAKMNGILGAPYLSSYGYTLMVLHYLQTVKPPVLPCLQQLFLSKPKGTVEMKKYTVFEETELKTREANVYFESKVDKVRAYMKSTFGSNMATVGELLTGFLIYFAFIFNTENTKISVREGLAKSKDDPYVFSIEDVFDNFSNAGFDIGVSQYAEIIQKMRVSAVKCVQDPVHILIT